MEELKGVLASGVWQSLGVVAAVVLGIVAILKQGKTRRLAFGVRRGGAEQPEPPLRNRVRAVSNVSVLTAGLINCGADCIRASDFEGPIVIRFQPGSDVKSYDVVGCNPAHLNLLIAQPDQLTLHIKPLLLNPGDRVLLQIAGHSLSRPVCEFRVAGVANVEPLTGPNSSAWSLKFSIGQVFVGYGLLFWLVHDRAPNDAGLRALAYVVLTVLLSLGNWLIIHRQMERARSYIKEVSEHLPVDPDVR
jgi:hypothetical protein